MGFLVFLLHRRSQPPGNHCRCASRQRLLSVCCWCARSFIKPRRRPLVPLVLVCRLQLRLGPRCDRAAAAPAGGCRQRRRRRRGAARTAAAAAAAAPVPGPVACRPHRVPLARGLQPRRPGQQRPARQPARWRRQQQRSRPARAAAGLRGSLRPRLPAALLLLLPAAAAAGAPRVCRGRAAIRHVRCSHARSLQHCGDRAPGSDALPGQVPSTACSSLNPRIACCWPRPPHPQPPPPFHPPTPTCPLFPSITTLPTQNTHHTAAWPQPLPQPAVCLRGLAASDPACRAAAYQALALYEAQLNAEAAPDFREKQQLRCAPDDAAAGSR